MSLVETRKNNPVFDLISDKERKLMSAKENPILFRPECKDLIREIDGMKWDKQK